MRAERPGRRCHSPVAGDCSAAHAEWVLIKDFVQIKAPYAVVRDGLLRPTPAWLTESANAAYAEGERLCLTLSPAGTAPGVRKRVQVELGTGYARGDGMVVPLSWWAVRGQQLFPTLEADLEIMPLGPGQVMLTLMGHYEPPLGPLGRGLDRLVLHRVAEACVRSFLHRTAASLEVAEAA